MLKKGSISMSREFMEKNSDSVQRQKDQGKPWAERNGAWIFLVLVIGGIVLLVLYEALFK